jgi:hypothetical protein
VDVVHVLRNMIEAVRPGGTILDLQVIRPNPRVEAGHRLICEVDGDPLFRQADAARAAIDAEIRRGRLIEEAADDHDVRKHYPNGTDLAEDFEDSARELPRSAIPTVRTITRSCVVRERCRLRRLTRLR